MGANATCTGWINENLKGQDVLATSINYKGKSDSQSIIELLAQLVSHGVDLDLSSLYADVSAVKAKRTFMKKIEVGGKRIFEVLLSEEMREQFADVRNKEMVGNNIPLPPFKGGTTSVQEGIEVQELELVEIGSNNLVANTNLNNIVNNFTAQKNSHQKFIQRAEPFPL